MSNTNLNSYRVINYKPLLTGLSCQNCGKYEYVIDQNGDILLYTASYPNQGQSLKQLKNIQEWNQSDLIIIVCKNCNCFVATR